MKVKMGLCQHVVDKKDVKIKSIWWNAILICPNCGLYNSKYSKNDNFKSLKEEGSLGVLTKN